MAVKFYLDKRPGKTGEDRIRVSLSIKGQRFLSTAGYSIRPETWDQEGQKVSTSYKTVNSKGATPKIINTRLRAIRSHFDEMEMRAIERPTRQTLQEELAKLTGAVRQVDRDDKNALDRFDEFVREEATANRWTDGTLQCWNAFRSHLAAQGQNIDFEKFTENGIRRFIEYLRDSRHMDEKTVKKHYSNLKWFLRWAIRKGYCSNTAINSYTPRFRIMEKPIIFLTAEELNQLYNYHIPENGERVSLTNTITGQDYEKVVESAAALEKTRDLFCFCAFTSLRYSDMANLKRSAIGDGVINVTTKKTNDRLVINLNDYAKSILQKYEDQHYPDDLALPVISNQRMNYYLKDLCELCGITDPVSIIAYKGGRRTETTKMKWELIGTHAARRTFVSYAISKGIPPETVMKWTGHSDYKAMKPYIEIAENEKEAAMDTINEQLIKTLIDVGTE